MFDRCKCGAVAYCSGLRFFEASDTSLNLSITISIFYELRTSPVVVGDLRRRVAGRFGDDHACDRHPESTAVATSDSVGVGDGAVVPAHAFGGDVAGPARFFRRLLSTAEIS